MPHARKRARSRRLKVKPERLDGAVEEFQRDQLPRFKAHSGFRGVTLLANQASGEMFAISYWESEADVEASAGLGDEAGAQFAESGEGSGEGGPSEWLVVVDEDA